MRAVGLVALMLLPAVSFGEMSEDCQRNQVEFAREMNARVASVQEALFTHVGLLQKHQKPEDEGEIRTRCEKIRAAVEDWEHPTHGNAQKLWTKALAAQKAFSKYMMDMVNRDRASWDASLKNLEAQGLKLSVNYSTFVITASKDLVAAGENRGVQKMKTVLDFCSPEATDGDLGSLTSKVVVSERPRGTKVVTLEPLEFARAHLAPECGLEVQEGAAFLRSNGALRPAKTTLSVRMPSDSGSRN